MAYCVKRYYSRHGYDYLMDWDERWGTSCIGSPAKAMQFPSEAAAEEAAAHAQRVCRTRNGVAHNVTFRASILHFAPRKDGTHG